MVVTLRSPLRVLESHLAASGWFQGGVAIGEPSEPPSSVHAAISMDRISWNIPQPLDQTSELRTVRIVLYARHMEEPRDEVELSLEHAVDEMMEDYFGDFQLGGVRAPSMPDVEAQFGYQQVAQTWYRIVEISLPLIVDNSATFAP